MTKNGVPQILQVHFQKTQLYSQIRQTYTDMEDKHDYNYY